MNDLQRRDGNDDNNRIEIAIDDTQSYLIRGLAGDDTISGGSGDDTIDAGIDNDSILARGGNDTVYARAGNDFVDGGSGNDTLLGAEGDDRMFGGDGYDVLKPYEQKGMPEFDVLTGGENPDLFDLTDISGSPAYLNDDALDGTTPKGFALITDFKPNFLGEGDKIKLSGFPAHYRLLPVSWGQQFGGANTADTTDAALVYIGSEQDKQDVVAVLQDVSSQFITNSEGFLNNPNIFVFDPNYQHPNPPTIIIDPPPPPPLPTDVFSSVSYTLQETQRNLTLTGTDNINGTGNGLDNILTGNVGVNALDGAAGNDTLIGGGGSDLLKGGLGADRFVFSSRADRVDRIQDFSRQEGDKLVFLAAGFENVRLGNVRRGQFVVGKKALDKNDRFIYNDKRGALFYDADGVGGVRQVRMATFADKPSLTAPDIIVAASPF